MNLSIEGKIRVLVYVPTALILLLASYIFVTKYKSYLSTGDLSGKISSLTTMSSLVSSLQKERGMSATFLGGGLSAQTLEAQRVETDALAESFRREFKSSSFSVSEIKIQYLSKLKSLRGIVNRKGHVTDILKSYTEIVYKLLALYKSSAMNSDVSEFKTLLTNSMIIEEAKESSGKLRANMSKTLAADEPIDQKTLAVLLKLKSGVDISLRSPALELDRNSIRLIKDFYQSAHWKDVNKTFAHILSKMNVGGYGRNGGEFFGVISLSVSALGDLVKVQSKLLKDIVESRFTSVKYELIQLAFAISGLFIFIFILTFKTSRSILRPLSEMSSSLEDVSAEVNESSGRLSEIGSQITERATAQASAIEETSASLEELVAMVNANLENSELSAEKTRQISTISEEGKESSEILLKAMNEIMISNQSIENIIGLISEIAEKTKVIDEIVFQTKLLSFNASVEAERAGEHGRGFSVVAQEVGNLAEMSGHAATEISEIVSKSVNDVNKLIKENGSKVEHGSSVAEKAAGIFVLIDGHSAEAASMSDRILSASREQNLGLKQINEAITQLDENTQGSVLTAEQMADSGLKLNQNSSVLRGEILKLTQLIKGV